MAEHLQGLRALGCTYPPESTGIRRPTATSPWPVTSTPYCSPHQWVAHARPVRLAKVALPTRAPPQVSGSPTSSHSHSSATSSTAEAKSDEAREKAFWSSSEVSQSAAIAAGVDPPITKWKKRGPLDSVAVAVPMSTSSATAF